MSTFKILTELKEKDIKDRKFLIRVDFNVPIDENGIVKDFTRIDASLKTLKYVIDNGGKAIVCSHLGRPKGQIIKALSMRPISDALSSRLGKKVYFIDDCIGKKVSSAIKKMKNGEILLLENLRFYKEEESYAKNKNLEQEGNKDQAEKNINFAKELARNYDYFINDAFAVCHRAHASVTGVIKEGNLPAYAGFLVEKELKVLLPLVKPLENSIAIIGGGKLKEKIGAIEAMAKKYTKIIVGGVVSNVFLSTKFNVGKSLIKEKKDDTDHRNIAKELLGNYDNIVLPKRVVIARDDFKEKKVIEISQGVPQNYSIFDNIIEQDILKEISNANVVVWCGPIGLFEKGFKDGNLSVGKALESNVSGITIIGGGETAEAAGRISVSHVSTGGGATLELLRYGHLPGIDALECKV